MDIKDSTLPVSMMKLCKRPLPNTALLLKSPLVFEATKRVRDENPSETQSWET